MNNKINIKDLITIGVFAAIYLTLYFFIIFLVVIPVLVLTSPAVAALITGIPFMLFLSKTDKFGMVTIMGTILGFIMFVTGHGWPVFIMGMMCGVLSDLIFKSGSYRNWKSLLVGYCVFSSWTIGAILNMWLLGETYVRQHLGESFGSSGVDSLVSLISNYWTLVLVAIFLVIGAVAGAYLGKAALKKHFKRAGIV